MSSYSFKHIIKNITYKPFQNYGSKNISRRKPTEFISRIRHLTDKFQSNRILWSKQSSKPTLTSHGAESKELFCVVVMGGTTPSHAIAAPIRGAVGVVAATVEEGEVAQGTIGVSTSCCYNGWIIEGTQQLLCISDLVTRLTILLCHVFRVWGLWFLKMFSNIYTNLYLVYDNFYIKTQQVII